MPDTISVKDSSGSNVTVNTNDALLAVLGALTDSKETNPDAASASHASLLRGLMQLVEDGIITQGTASVPSAEYISTHARMTEQTLMFRNTPTVSTSAYAAGDVVGGEIEITNAARISGDGGVLASCSLSCEDDLAASDIEVLLFDSNPTGTYTDNAALAVPDADTYALIAAVDLDKKTDTGDGSFLQGRNVMVPYQADATSLWAVMVCRNAFTLTATNAIQLNMHLIRD